MKIRNGFVSNSSSSSFCLLGVSFTERELEKAGIEDVYSLSFGFTNNITAEKGLETYYDEFIFGMPVESIPDNKTLKEVKEEVHKNLDKQLSAIGLSMEGKAVRFHYDGGYD